MVCMKNMNNKQLQELCPRRCGKCGDIMYAEGYNEHNTTYSFKVLGDSVPIATVSGGREILFKCVKCSKKVKIRSMMLIMKDIGWLFLFLVLSIIGISIIGSAIGHVGFVGLIKSLPKDLTGKGAPGGIAFLKWTSPLFLLIFIIFLTDLFKEINDRVKCPRIKK